MGQRQNWKKILNRVVESYSPGRPPVGACDWCRPRVGPFVATPDGGNQEYVHEPGCAWVVASRAVDDLPPHDLAAWKAEYAEIVSVGCGRPRPGMVS